jgi:type I restriction enzyme, S subunit
VKYSLYSKYKGSGVEWLGDVPEHWEVKRSDVIVSADRTQLSPETFADCEVFHYSIPVVQETGNGQVENGESIASAKQVIKKPVILVSKLNPRKATICLAKPQSYLTVCSTEFVSLNADKCELPFLEYVTRSEFFRQGLDSKVQSVTRSHQRANPADISKFWSAWPTLEEQRTIAAFLDRETGRIDQLIAKKQELIERLKEKRIALISRAVTKGLDPKAKLKPSGVEWLGDIPEHWESLSLRRISTRYSGGTPDKSNDSYWSDGTIPWINSGAVNQEMIKEPSAFITEDAYLNSSAKWVPKGALVMALAGQGKTKGMVAQMGIEATCNQSMAAICPSLNVNSRYLYWLLAIQYKEIRNMAGGEQRDGLNLEMLGTIPCLRAPFKEQSIIAEFIDFETGKIDRLVKKVEEAIERLQEYRLALITSAVTGKIDVRKTAT